MKIDINEFLHLKFKDEGEEAKESITITLTSAEWFQLQEAKTLKPKFEERIQKWIDYSYHLKSIIGELSWKDKKYVKRS